MENSNLSNSTKVTNDMEEYDKNRNKENKTFSEGLDR
jgi:hypothetical protein